MIREAIAGAVAIGWPEAKTTLVADFPAAWAAAAERPDLISSDLAVPGAKPIDGIRQLQAASPTSAILVVTGSEDDATLLALLDLGIAGVASKTAKSAVIEAAIRLIPAGGRYLPPRVMEIVNQRRDGSAEGRHTQATNRTEAAIKARALGLI